MHVCRDLYLILLINKVLRSQLRLCGNNTYSIVMFKFKSIREGRGAVCSIVCRTSICQHTLLWKGCYLLSQLYCPIQCLTLKNNLVCKTFAMENAWVNVISSSSTHYKNAPICSASWAPTLLPVRIISNALDNPIKAGSLTVPPSISGTPNTRRCRRCKQWMVVCVVLC